MKNVVHAACPHDCPDACGVLITVEDGRATKIQGDPSHPVTRGFLCAKVAKYLDRVYSPGRVLYPMRRVVPKGSGSKDVNDFQRISWDEALREVADRLSEYRHRIRPGSDPALLLRWHTGHPQRRLHGSAFLPPTGGLATRASNLFGSGRGRIEVRHRREARHRARAVSPLALHHRLGRQHSRQQRAPVAVHRGSPPRWRKARGHRSLQDSNREVR